MAVYIAVSGPADADEASCAVAEQVGRLLARSGAIVLTGGLGGVMAAVSRGAHDAGGTTIALLPGSDRAGANDWVDFALPTGLGQGRNLLLVTAADAVIAVGGSWGTLSEVAHARRLGRPVVQVGGWTVTDASGSPVSDDVVSAADAETAVTAALALAQGDPNHS